MNKGQTYTHTCTQNQIKVKTSCVTKDWKSLPDFGPSSCSLSFSLFVHYQYNENLHQNLFWWLKQSQSHSCDINFADIFDHIFVNFIFPSMCSTFNVSKFQAVMFWSVGRHVSLNNIHMKVPKLTLSFPYTQPVLKWHIQCSVLEHFHTRKHQVLQTCLQWQNFAVRVIRITDFTNEGKDLIQTTLAIAILAVLINQTQRVATYEYACYFATANNVHVSLRLPTMCMLRVKMHVTLLKGIG